MPTGTQKTNVGTTGQTGIHSTTVSNVSSQYSGTKSTPASPGLATPAGSGGGKTSGPAPSASTGKGESGREAGPAGPGAGPGSEKAGSKAPDTAKASPSPSKAAGGGNSLKSETAVSKEVSDKAAQARAAADHVLAISRGPGILGQTTPGIQAPSAETIANLKREQTGTPPQTFAQPRGILGTGVSLKEVPRNPLRDATLFKMDPDVKAGFEAGKINVPSISSLVNLAKAWKAETGLPLHLTEGYAPEGHVSKSQHKLGTAFDLAVGTDDPTKVDRFMELAAENGFRGRGVYSAPEKGIMNPRGLGWVHIDTRAEPTAWGPDLTSKSIPDFFKSSAYRPGVTQPMDRTGLASVQPASGPATVASNVGSPVDRAIKSILGDVIGPSEPSLHQDFASNDMRSLLSPAPSAPAPPSAAKIAADEAAAARRGLEPAAGPIGGMLTASAEPPAPTPRSEIVGWNPRTVSSSIGDVITELQRKQGTFVPRGTEPQTTPTPSPEDQIAASQERQLAMQQQAHLLQERMDRMRALIGNAPQLPPDRAIELASRRSTPQPLVNTASATAVDEAVRRVANEVLGRNLVAERTEDMGYGDPLLPIERQAADMQSRLADLMNEKHINRPPRDFAARTEDMGYGAPPAQTARTSTGDPVLDAIRDVLFPDHMVQQPEVTQVTRELKRSLDPYNDDPDFLPEAGISPPNSAARPVPSAPSQTLAAAEPHPPGVDTGITPPNAGPMPVPSVAGIPGGPPLPERSPYKRGDPIYWSNQDVAKNITPEDLPENPNIAEQPPQAYTPSLETLRAQKAQEIANAVLGRDIMAEPNEGDTMAALNETPTAGLGPATIQPGLSSAPWAQPAIDTPTATLKPGVTEQMIASKVSPELAAQLRNVKTEADLRAVITAEVAKHPIMFSTAEAQKKAVDQYMAKAKRDYVTFGVERQKQAAAEPHPPSTLSSRPLVADNTQPATTATPPGEKPKAVAPPASLLPVKPAPPDKPIEVPQPGQVPGRPSQIVTNEEKGPTPLLEPQVISDLRREPEAQASTTRLTDRLGPGNDQIDRIQLLADRIRNGSDTAAAPPPTPSEEPNASGLTDAQIAALVQTILGSGAVA
jgi:hypothetical protein